MNIVHFRFVGIASELWVNPPVSEQAIFSRDDISLMLELKMVEGQRWSEPGDCLLTVQAAREAPAELFAAFDRRSLESRGESQPTRDDRALSLNEIRWLMPPDQLLDFCEDVRSELHSAGAHLVKLLRWFFNRDSPAEPLAHTSFTWSVDGESFQPVPERERALPAFGSEGAELSGEALSALEEIWRSREIAEPDARQILLEAVEAAYTNRRAAFILAMVAAEVGVKRFASLRSSSLSEAWLLENTLSPPLDRLVRDYLVALTDKKTESGAAVPRDITTVLEKSVQVRNRLVHRGEEPPSEKEIGTLLVTVNDLLYLLDWFEGRDWAFHHVTEERRAAYRRTDDADAE